MQTIECLNDGGAIDCIDNKYYVQCWYCWEVHALTLPPSENGAPIRFDIKKGVVDD